MIIFCPKFVLFNDIEIPTFLETFYRQESLKIHYIKSNQNKLSLYTLSFDYFISSFTGKKILVPTHAHS